MHVYTIQVLKHVFFTTFLLISVHNLRHINFINVFLTLNRKNIYNDFTTTKLKIPCPFCMAIPKIQRKNNENSHCERYTYTCIKNRANLLNSCSRWFSFVSASISFNKTSILFIFIKFHLYFVSSRNQIIFTLIFQPIFCDIIL